MLSRFVGTMSLCWMSSGKCPYPNIALLFAPLRSRTLVGVPLKSTMCSPALFIVDLSLRHNPSLCSAICWHCCIECFGGSPNIWVKGSGSPLQGAYFVSSWGREEVEDVVGEG